LEHVLEVRDLLKTHMLELESRNSFDRVCCGATYEHGFEEFVDLKRVC
jgi:hypothetical protein